MAGFFKVFGGVIGAFVLVAWLLSPIALFRFDRDPKATGLVHCHLPLHICNFDWPESPAAKAAQAVSDLGQCRTNNASLTASLTAQNEAVAATKARGDQMTAQAQKAVQHAEIGLGDAQKRAASILATKSSTGDQCAAAEALVRETVR